MAIYLDEAPADRPAHEADGDRPPTQAPELRYRRLFEAARDGILILDADSGVIVEANPFLAELLGCERRDFLGKELWEIGLFRDRDASRAAYTALRESGYLRHDHLPLKARDGREVEVEVVSNLYREGLSEVIQCNIRDITERRALERRVQAQSEELAVSVRRKAEYLAVMSHELRNPLAAILNAVQILGLAPERAPAQAKAQAIIGRQVGQLIRLVEDLMEATRLATGVVGLRRERCEAGGLVRRAIEGVDHAIAVHGLVLSASIPPGPIWLDADPGRVEQVVTNLLMNAIKYTDAAGRIDVSLAREGAEMVLRVRDTGIGIAPALLPRVFDLFAQADRSLARSEGGVGVGLTVVRRLVELHGGSVEAHSAGLGRGSEFVVRLPAEGGSSPGEDAAGVPPALRVLVVDDNVDYAEGVALLLRASGYCVEIALTGPEALDAAPGFRPDVVVLDIGLPGMDGYEVARRFRLDPAFQKLRVVGISGYRKEEGPLGRGASFDEYLLKPVLRETLVASLRP